MLSGTDASCVATALAPCLVNEKEQQLDQTVVQTKISIRTHKSYDTLNAGWAKRLQNLLHLEDPSFDELLDIVNPAVAERNTDVREAVALSVQSIR